MVATLPISVFPESVAVAVAVVVVVVLSLWAITAPPMLPARTTSKIAEIIISFLFFKMPVHLLSHFPSSRYFQFSI
jgi:hypothetical protein